MADALQQYDYDENEPQTESIVTEDDKADLKFINQLNLDFAGISKSLYSNSPDTFLSEATISVEILPRTLLMFSIDPTATVDTTDPENIKVSDKVKVEVALAAIRSGFRSVPKVFFQTMNSLRFSSQRELGHNARLTALSMALANCLKIKENSLIIFNMDTEEHFTPSRTYSDFLK